MYVFVKYLIIIIISTLMFTHANAATITAKSCSQTNVQAAIASANNGDTVIVPAGDCTWDSIKLTKGINLTGAGIDATVISSSGRAITLDVDSGTAPRLTGFTFSGGKATLGIVSVSGNVNGWRIDNNRFTGQESRCLTITDTESAAPSVGIAGLIDNNRFEDWGVQAILIRPSNTHAEELWKTETKLGSPDAVYIEDNSFDNTGNIEPALDNEYGAKTVFRHNELIDSWVLNHGLEWRRGTLKMEVYENTFSQTKSWTSTSVIVFRGGTGVVFNNTITGKWWHPLMIRDYCSSGTSGCNTKVYPKGCNSYPCIDQVGRTHDQKLEPLYQWGNTINGTPVKMYVFNPSKERAFNTNDAIKEDRDFYNASHPNYTPYTYPHPLTGLSASSNSSVPSPPPECWILSQLF